MSKIRWKERSRTKLTGRQKDIFGGLFGAVVFIVIVIFIFRVVNQARERVENRLNSGTVITEMDMKIMVLDALVDLNGDIKDVRERLVRLQGDVSLNGDMLYAIGVRTNEIEQDIKKIIK